LFFRRLDVLFERFARQLATQGPPSSATAENVTADQKRVMAEAVVDSRLSGFRLPATAPFAMLTVMLCRRA
jgi:hypothetical protein